MQGLIPVIVLLIVLAVVIFVGKSLLPGLLRGQGAYPYRREPTLFTPAERSFLGVLEQSLQGQSRVSARSALAMSLR